MLLSDPTSHTPPIAARRHIGTIRMIERGSDQLSYCAASTRNTSTAPIAKTKGAVFPARICCRVSSVHSNPIDGGSSFRASSSMIPMAWPELTPGAVPPEISADGNML